MVSKVSGGLLILQNCKFMFISKNALRQTSRIAGQEAATEDFRVLDLKQKKKTVSYRRKPRKVVIPPPRSEKMAVDQPWSSVWPGPRTFHPAAVPLPLHQGYPHKKNAPPGKFGNAELMKIPNFLHLTPPAIKQQCEALKKFCTDWPKGLETEEQQEAHFPIEISTSTYCHSSPSIRDPLSRIVTLKVHVRSLPLDEHAKDKLLRLVEDRYDPATDLITLVADRCPTRRQNTDYVQYLLTALFHESWKVEPWESDKQRADMEMYEWEGSPSQKTFDQLVKLIEAKETSGEHKVGEQEKEKYKDAVESLFNSGEDSWTLNVYKEATKKLLSLQLSTEKR